MEIIYRNCAGNSSASILRRLGVAVLRIFSGSKCISGVEPGRSTNAGTRPSICIDSTRLFPRMSHQKSNILNNFCLKQESCRMEERFTSAEVVELTGISARQLQWWDEQGIVVPSRQGHRRLYSLDDLAEVAVIADLRRRGFPLQRVRRVVRFLQRELGSRLAQTVSGSSEYHLLTDGSRLYLETSARQIVDLLKNARQPILSVCLSDTVRQIRAHIRGRKKASASARPQPHARRKAL